ncbi:hypothetical protein FDECE_7992 [Fusarium decemcellulare]|nr:hypothetical protein FDECE_7992 [Fusarium decemcellulare]
MEPSGRQQQLSRLTVIDSDSVPASAEASCRSSKLRLKAGQRYALFGRNGSGKSTLLKAIAEKLIPGISRSVCEEVIEPTTARPDVEQDTRTLSAGIRSRPEKGGPMESRQSHYWTLYDLSKNGTVLMCSRLRFALLEHRAIGGFDDLTR